MAMSHLVFTHFNLQIGSKSSVFYLSTVVLQLYLQLFQFLPDFGTGDGGELILMTVIRHQATDFRIRQNAGMEVEFSDTILQIVENFEDIFLSHPPRIQNTFDFISKTDPETIKFRTGVIGEKTENYSFESFAKYPRTVKLQIMEKSFLRHAKTGDTVTRHQFSQNFKNSRMEVYVQVTVNL